MAVLRAIAGPIKGAVFHLTEDEITVGRLPSSQLCIGDPSVSRQHCLIQPGADGFRLRDLGSNNGTFLNGKRVDECIVAEGDKIRIGDTVLCFFANGAMSLPDNGAIANSSVEVPASGYADTAIRKLLNSEDSGFAARAGNLLIIGARLNAVEAPGELMLEILKRIVDVMPAEQAAIVLLARDTDADLTITGWTRNSSGPSQVSISRSVVTRAIRNDIAIFSADVGSSEDFSGVTSLTRRRVESLIVVPLHAHGKITGAIYLDSSDRVRLDQEHLQFITIIADYAGPAIERAFRLEILREGSRYLQSAFQVKHNFIGTSPPMRLIFERIAKLARTDATVMIRGETGTGKELAARAIHENSARALRPFIAINCSLLRDALLESELFGHERGSFTGAVVRKQGKLELANGGTVFLDELGALGESSQAMLLRVLQTREFQRLGGTQTLHVDVRIIAATNEDLEAAVAARAFRQDLYYRLNVVSLAMPSLRERREDIPLLADHFVQLYSRKNKRAVTGLSPEAAGVLLSYDWPGNVRELENVIEYAIVFGSTSEILPYDFPDSLHECRPTAEPCVVGYHDAVREAKREIVLSALRQSRNNYAEAAKQLGIHVNNLHRLIRDLNLKEVLSLDTRGTSSSRALRLLMPD